MNKLTREIEPAAVSFDKPVFVSQYFHDHAGLIKTDTKPRQLDLLDVFPDSETRIQHTFSRALRSMTLSKMELSGEDIEAGFWKFIEAESGSGIDSGFVEQLIKFTDPVGVCYESGWIEKHYRVRLNEKLYLGIALYGDDDGEIGRKYFVYNYTPGQPEIQVFGDRFAA